MKFFQCNKGIFKRAKEEKWYLLAIFPPWYVYYWIRSERKNNTEHLKPSDSFFILWIFCQWLLMFFTNKDIFMGFITANAAIFSFLGAASFLIFTPRGLDISTYPSDLQKFLKSLPIQTLGILPVILIMNICSSFMYLIVGSIKVYCKMLGEHWKVAVSVGKAMELTIRSFYCTSYHTIIQFALILLLFVFAIVNRYKTFELLPVLDLREKLALFSSHKNKIFKFNILAIYITLIIFYLGFNTLGFAVKNWGSIMFKLPGF